MGSCPFVCKWMNKKNPYLLSELYKLKNLLDNQSDYYTTNFFIEYKYADKDRMGKYIPFISNYLNNENRQTFEVTQEGQVENDSTLDTRGIFDDSLDYDIFNNS